METVDPSIGALIDLAEQGDGGSAEKLFTLLYGNFIAWLPARASRRHKRQRHYTDSRSLP